MNLLHSALRLITWHRRAVAALLAGLGVLSLVHALGPQPTPTRPVVMTAHEIPGGQRLTDADLAVVQVPHALVPEAAMSDPADAIGHTLTATTPRGIPITDRALVGQAAIAPGRVLSPIRFADADLARILRVGHHIDIVAAGPDAGAEAVVAHRVRVVAMPNDDSTETFASTGDGLLVLVEVTTEQATALAQISGRTILTPVVLDG